MKKSSLIIIVLIPMFIISGLSYSILKSKTAENQGQNHSASETNKKGERAEKKNSPKAKTNDNKKTIKLHFPNGSNLKVEERKGLLDAETALKLLLKGPSSRGNVSYVPKGVRLLGLKKDGTTAEVNFSKEILEPSNVGAMAEELTIYSIVNTLTEFDDISEVIFKVEGKSEGEVDGYPVEDFWGHFGLYDQPFKRNEELIRVKGKG